MIASYEAVGILLVTEVLILPAVRSAITLVSKCASSPHCLKAASSN